MDAKEKAKELVDNMFLKMYNTVGNPRVDVSKKCALILCDEIIELKLELCHDDNVTGTTDFYKEVREEINKL